MFVDVGYVVQLYQCVGDVGQCCYGMFYFVQFDLEVMQFDLCVVFFYVFQLFVVVDVGQIIGVVQVCVVCIEWIGYEVLCGQGWLVEVVLCEVCVVDMQFVEYVGWYWLQVGIQQVQVEVGDWVIDQIVWLMGIVLDNFLVGYVYCCFGDVVYVDQVWFCVMMLGKLWCQCRQCECFVVEYYLVQCQCLLLCFVSGIIGFGKLQEG